MVMLEIYVKYSIMLLNEIPKYSYIVQCFVCVGMVSEYKCTKPVNLSPLFCIHIFKINNMTRDLGLDVYE